MKLQMLTQHESQMKWMKNHDGIDFEEFVRSVARFRGLQSGVTYAEAFRPCMVWLRTINMYAHAISEKKVSSIEAIGMAFEGMV